MDAHKLGRFIAENRKAKGMTQRDLAIKIEVTDKAVSRWERGMGFPDISTLEPLAEALDVSLLELIKCERIAEEPLGVNETENVVLSTLDIAVAQNLEERRKVFFALAAALVFSLSILVFDATGGCMQILVFILIGAFFPLMGAFSGILLLICGIWRKLHHKSAKNFFLACGCSFVILIAFCIANIILIKAGIFPPGNYVGR